MEAQVSWSIAIILILAAAAHIAEEAVADFRGFLNTQWFDGNDDCPVTRRKGILIDKIGLFAGLVLFAVLGAALDARVIFIAVGILCADIVQHAIFSLKKKAYTPGIATCALYLAYVVYFFSQPATQGWLGDGWARIALVVGAGGIAINYALSWWKVHRGDCRLAAA